MSSFAAARAWKSRLGIGVLENRLHLKSSRRSPLSFFDLRCAGFRCAALCRRARTRPLRNGGNARAHGRALPLPPRPPPVRRGRGRIAGSNRERSVRPTLVGLLVVGGLGLCFGLGRFLGGLEVHGAHLAAIVLLEVVADALVLAQRAHSGLLDGGHVDERVVSAAVRRDEAVALMLVKEFHCSSGHFDFPSVAEPQFGPLRARSDKRRKRSRKAPVNRQFATSSGRTYRPHTQ